MRKAIPLLLALACAAASLPAAAQTANYKIVGHIALPDGGWDYATFDPDSRRVYVARRTTVDVAEVDSGKVTAGLAMVAGGHAAVPLPGGRILATNGNADTATFLDAKTGKVLTTVATAKGPDAAIYDPKSGLAFVIAHKGGAVTFIDAAKQTAVETVTLGGMAAEFAAVDNAGRLWVNDEEANEIVAVDIKSRAIVGRHKLDGCDGPTGLIYAPAADRLVASCDKVAVAIDPASGRIVDRLTVGAGPDAVIYDPVRKLAFVPAGQSGDLTVIDASGPKLKVLQTLKTQGGARTGAIDPKTGKLYLPTARLVAPASGQGRRTAAPGSVELLVVAP
jgi:DNA-binding beta-propeller fold protein YncE